LADVLSLSVPRTDDDPLAAVVPPVDVPVVGAKGIALTGDSSPSHIELVHAALAARLPIPGALIAIPETESANLTTGSEVSDFIEGRLKAWNESKPKS
jgi:hypothetical protein